MNWSKFSCVKLCLFLFFYLSSSSAQKIDPVPVSSGTTYISFSNAVFDILKKGDTSVEWRLEFRRDFSGLAVDPLAGMMINTDGARFIYAGISYELPLFDFLSVIPSFSPGLYSKNKSKELHFLLEFRSQIELSFHFDLYTRLGVSFNHISNASLGKSNPGVESLAISYTFSI